MSPQNRHDSNSGSIWKTAIWQGVITISSESQLTAVWLWSVSTLTTKTTILSFKKSYIAICLSGSPFQQNTYSHAEIKNRWIPTKPNWPTHSLTTWCRLLLDKLTEPVSLEIPRILWKSAVYHSINNSLLLPPSWAILIQYRASKLI